MKSVFERHAFLLQNNDCENILTDTSHDLQWSPYNNLCSAHASALPR